MNKKNSKGQTIVEAMVSISIALVGLLGVLSLTSRSMAFNNDMSQKFVASYLAAEGIEIVKNLIDTDIVRGRNWDSNINNIGPYEYEVDTISGIRGQFLSTNLKLNGGKYEYSTGVDTPYTRKVVITKLNTDSTLADYEEIKVESVVLWKSRGSDITVNVIDVFKRWR